jgi:1,4-alpha-glucan branching enzyme
MFDGTHTYEYADMRKGYHPDWNSYIFNYKRGEVRSFLISNARFWLDKFHVDGLRVDAVSSMLKLDYSRNEGEWEPNEFGGNGNIEAIDFLKKMNEMVYRDFKGVQTIAEEATNWPGVSRPTYTDGLGFGMKWMMGWMHDTLKYFKQDPVYRQFQQNQLTFSMMYYYDENFMLPLSHDEVVHGKSPMIYKMPGDEWQKFANLRLLYTYMFMHPGAKLLFMGNEFGQTDEWNYKTSLRWDLLEYDCHKGMKNCVSTLAHLMKNESALSYNQFDYNGFEWHDLEHRSESVISFIRRGKNPNEELLIVLNMTPVERTTWFLKCREKGEWKEVFNSDQKEYWGSDHFKNKGKLKTQQKSDGEYYLSVQLPPLAGCVFKKIK